MVKILQSDQNHFEKAAQVADIQIRLTKRQDEYREVFERFYTQLESITDPTIVIIAGDVFHNKTDLSPESVQLCKDFLVKTADLKPTILVAGNHDCYSPDHEILTETGWVCISDYVNRNDKHKVATFNSESGEIEFQNPLGVVKKHFDGDMINFLGKNIDLFTTPTHQILYYHSTTKKFYKSNASDVPKTALIPINGIVNKFDPDPFYKLLGFSFAEATFVLRQHKIPNKNRFDGCRVQFHVKCKREIDYLMSILSELKYITKVRPQKDGSFFIVIYSDLAKQICQFFDAKKEIPNDILKVSNSQKKSFLDGYLHGDGHKFVAKKDYWTFSSISEKSIDLLCTIARFTGASSSKQKRIIFGNYKNSKQQYCGGINRNGRVNNTSIKTTRKISYDGYVYCVSVPNSNILVRRNGKICISGNCNLANKNRLDSLTPIVDAIKHPKLHYLRNSGLYAIGNILFNNMSVFDFPDKYTKGVNIPDVYRNKYDHVVGLYHGTVDAAVNDLGYVITNKEVSCDFFDGHHIMMLGDIHKAQDLQEFVDENPLKPIIRYCGSMIQQNHGELFDGHGYTIWDLVKKEYEHIDLQNDFGYYTIDVNKGQLDTDLSTIPPKCRLRVRCFESVVTEVKKIMMDIRDKTDLQEVIYERVPSEDDKKVLVITGKDLELTELNKLDHQESLITKYLKNKLKIEDEDKISAVVSVNSHVNGLLTKDFNPPAIRWKPKRFEWSNMFSYGEGNVIDFSKVNGLCGLFAPNRSGKSSVMSALSFCIFDKCDRTSKASEVLNIHKSGFTCKFNFEISGVDYFISREGTADRKGNVSVKTNFWKEENGEIVSLNGEKRSDTNEKIREFFGTYEDFVLTSLSVQNVKNAASFIDIGNTERKDILSQFLGLGIFDRLHTIASERLNELSVIIKTFSKDDEVDKLSKLQEIQTNLQSLSLSSQEEKQRVSDSINGINDQIVKATSKLIKLDESVGNWTEDQIRKSLKDLEKQHQLSTNDTNITIEKYVNGLPPLQKIVEIKTSELHEVENKILEVEKKNVSESYKEYQSSLAEYNRIKNELDRLTITIKNQEEKIDHLSKHEFDPNCQFCIRNAGKNGDEAVKTKLSLEENKRKQSLLSESLDKSKKKTEEKEWVIKEQEVFTKLLTTRNRTKDEHTIAKHKISEIEKSVDQLKRRLIDSETKYQQDVKVWSDRLEKFLSNKDAIQSIVVLGIFLDNHAPAKAPITPEGLQ